MIHWIQIEVWNWYKCQDIKYVQKSRFKCLRLLSITWHPLSTDHFISLFANAKSIFDIYSTSTNWIVISIIISSHYILRYQASYV